MKRFEVMRSCTFPGRYESLTKIASFIREAAREAGLDSFSIYTVETAVDEACTNIIEHSYQGENKGKIDLSCKIERSGLTIILRDDGIPFDPEQVPTPRLEGPLEERQGRGLGLYFMRELMDEVRFDFDEKTGNILTMVKYKEKHKG